MKVLSTAMVNDLLGSVCVHSDDYKMWILVIGVLYFSGIVTVEVC